MTISKLDERRRAAGFDQAALDAAARIGFSNGAFEHSIKEGAAIAEEFYPEASDERDIEAGERDESGVGAHLAEPDTSATLAMTAAATSGNRSAARRVSSRSDSQNQGKPSLLDKLDGKAAALPGKAT